MIASICSNSTEIYISFSSYVFGETWIEYDASTELIIASVLVRAQKVSVQPPESVNVLFNMIRCAVHRLITVMMLTV